MGEFQTKVSVSLPQFAGRRLAVAPSSAHRFPPGAGALPAKSAAQYVAVGIRKQGGMGIHYGGHLVGTALAECRWTYASGNL
jgi:hypothetical protein